MAWIRTISEAEATDDVARQYKAAVKRAGKVYQIVKIQSLRPDIMRTFLELYTKIMHGASGLTRTEREMVATVVSRVNHCHY
jgi:uncharacterized peroxidase-related enzyme